MRNKIILYAIIGAGLLGGCSMTHNNSAYVTTGSVIMGAALGAMCAL